jgi:hypothetical protein
LHVDGRAGNERVRHTGEVREDSQVRDAPEEVDRVERVAAGVGVDEPQPVAFDIDRVRVDPCGPINRMRPNRSATGFCFASASREIVGPVWVTLGSVGPPLVTITVSLPSTMIPCGPIALSLFGVFA